MSDQGSDIGTSAPTSSSGAPAEPTTPSPGARRKKGAGKLVGWIIAAIVLAVAVIGGALYLIRSIQTRPIVVPNVLRLSQAAAATQLTAVGLKVGTVSKVATSQVGVDLVVTQKPDASATVPKGSGVDLALAVEPVDVSTPNLVGMTGDAATQILAENLFIPKRYREYSTTVPTGTVAAQLPAAGVPTKTGNVIFVSVSIGYGKGNTVPNLIGTSQAQAATSLKLAGINPVWNYTNINPAHLPVGSIIAQAPSAGTVIPTDEVVAASVATKQ
jgi:beta-lactam-binding protein with PASTA domain